MRIFVWNDDKPHSQLELMSKASLKTLLSSAAFPHRHSFAKITICCDLQYLFCSDLRSSSTALELLLQRWRVGDYIMSVVIFLVFRSIFNEIRACLALPKCNFDTLKTRRLPCSSQKSGSSRPNQVKAHSKSEHQSSLVL